MFNSYFVLHFNLAFQWDQTSILSFFLQSQSVEDDCKSLFEFQRSWDEYALIHIHKQPLAIIPTVFNVSTNLLGLKPHPPL